MSDVTNFYETNAAAFDRDRGRAMMERTYLDDVLSRLDPEYRHVLDLGCGAGEPIARYLIDAGCRVTGVDASSAMVALCSERFLAWTGANGFEVLRYCVEDPDCGRHTVWLAQAT